MTLEEAEKKLGFNYPEKLHKIHDMGALEWMELERGEYSREVFRKYSAMPDQFMMLSCDIEPIVFCDLSDEIDYLNELVGYKCEDDGVKLKDGVRLFPFATTGGGDFFCFICTEDTETAKLGWYYHDDYDTPAVCAESFEEFLYFALLNAASWGAADDDDIESEAFQFHIGLLSDEYKAKVEGKSLEELADDYEDLILRPADIWEKA